MISVILPVYNEARYIARMLESLTQQSIDSWEAVVVDDGSTDNTVDIVAGWAAADSRIRLIDPQTKLGKVKAFNRAFAESSGDLICHVGGDDVLPRHGLEHRVRSLVGAPDRAVSFGKLQFIDPAGRSVGRPIPRGSHGSQSSPGATYTRSLADLLFPIPEALPSEDIWLGNGARACSQEVRHVDEVVTLYRRHHENSNPRHRPFDVMNEAIARRMGAYELLMSSALPLPTAARAEFENRVETERLRYQGRTMALLAHRGTAAIDRLALASMSRSSLWRMRQRLGPMASGWRRR